MDSSLIDIVLLQIQVDIRNEDLTALAELLQSVPERTLKGYIEDLSTLGYITEPA